MKRRYGAGAVIIGIFVAGVSVTSLTERYVSSAVAGTAAFSGAEAQAAVDAEAAEEAKISEKMVAAGNTGAAEGMKTAEGMEAAEGVKTAEGMEAAEDAEAAEGVEAAGNEEGMDAAGDAETAEAETAQTALSMLRQSLEETEIETEALLAANASGQQGYDVWAAQLSEIEALLQDRLTAGEAEQLQEKQAAWRETLWAEEGNGSAGRSREETERLREETGRIRKRCYELLELYEDTLDGEGE